MRSLCAASHLASVKCRKHCVLSVYLLLMMLNRSELLGKHAKARTSSPGRGNVVPPGGTGVQPFEASPACAQTPPKRAGSWVQDLAKVFP